MNMIPAVDCVARVLPSESTSVNQPGADYAPTLHG
jgi:hypothetical protein